VITDLKRIVEAVLFAAETPLSLAQICQVLETKDKAPVQNALEELSKEYDFLERAFALVEVAGGWRLRTRPDMAFWLRKLKRQSKTRLSRASLETLAIIAYKQPVLKAEIERIRGVEVSGVLRMLMEKELVRVVGRKDLPGRPLIYGTTKRFLEVFDLKDLSDLPTLEEMQELLGDPDVVKEGEEDETPLFTRGMAGQDDDDGGDVGDEGGDEVLDAQGGEETPEGRAQDAEPDVVVELGEGDEARQVEAVPEPEPERLPDEPVVQEPEPASQAAYDQAEAPVEETPERVEVELAPEQNEPEPAGQSGALTIEPSGYRIGNTPRTQDELAQPRPDESDDLPDQDKPDGEPGPQAA
jgi:segregation and condensation protein B